MAGTGAANPGSGRHAFLIDQAAAADGLSVPELPCEAAAAGSDLQWQAEKFHAWLTANKMCPCRPRILAEKRAEKVEELARSNRELEQFAYIASHDLQEPLRMVAVYTQLLSERYRGQLDENADKYIGYATEGALRMQSLIQDLLTFSRIDRDGATPGKVDCNGVVREALQNLRPAIQECEAAIAVEALPVISADRSQIVQLFQNLIGNALKFRGQQPASISILAEKTDQSWLFSVADNGIGIAPEYADSIFAVFQRLHTRTEYPGNGIGLAICKKIVEHYNGKIWVESQAGQGAIFKFTLPAYLANEDAGARR